MARALPRVRLRQAYIGSRRGAGSHCGLLQRLRWRCRHRCHDGCPGDIVITPSGKPSKVARAINAWRNADPATGSLVERYLQSRGITRPPPASIRFLPRQRNWSDGGTYPAMISLVQRVPSDEDHAALQSAVPLIDAGAHFTFLQGGRT